MTASRVPAVMDALVAVYTANLSNVTVIHGPIIAREVGRDVAAVGTSPEDLASARASRTEMPGFGARVVQQFAVTCTLSSADGGSDVKARRDRVAAMFDSIDTALRADRSLGGVVGTSVLTDEQWLLLADPNGVACDMTFVVAGEVYL